MKMKIKILFGLLVPTAVFAQPQPAVQEYPNPLVRESQTVIVNGVPETWQLEWTRVPQPFCGPGDPYALSSPCFGFAYGESGPMELVRRREGVAIDHLFLGSVFDKSFFADFDDAEAKPGMAYIQRWPERKEDIPTPDPTVIRQRPPVKVMQIKDYDNDGQASEFYLQTETRPAGKSYGVVVGVTKDKPFLHAIGTKAHPAQPLVLSHIQWEILREWEVLSESVGGPIEVMDWACGDHASPQEWTVALNWGFGDVYGERHIYACKADESRGRLLKVAPLEQGGVKTETVNNPLRVVR
jgi:hypothetical protein